MYITYETHETRWVLVFSQKKRKQYSFNPFFRYESQEILFLLPLIKSFLCYFIFSLRETFFTFFKYTSIYKFCY